MNPAIRPLIMLLGAALLCSPLLAQPSLNLADKLPLDPTVRTGTLKNGLTYYIRKNGKPEKRADLRLVVNAGSVLEDPEQQGLAHFVEHMAFNGTRNFEKHEIVNFLEGIGMRFGADLNAYTSFDETVYMLQLPASNIKVLDTGVRILREWAHEVSFDPQEIDKERGVVIEEWRGRRGAEARMRDKSFPVLFYSSLYAERLPIGKKDILENFKHESLVKFYKEWYRPELMAVIAVGDFDLNVMEKMIQDHFNSIPASQSRRTRTTTAIPDHSNTLFSINSDPEASRSAITINYKHQFKPLQTVGDYRRAIVTSLYNDMLNQRFQELSQQADPPFLFASSGNYNFHTVKEMYQLSAQVPNGGVERGLKALLTEAERVKRHGFTQSELDRTKLETVRAVQKAHSERDKTESDNYTAEYTRYFLEGTGAPGIDYEYALYQQYVPTITLAEVNAVAAQWIVDKNRVISVVSPEKKELKIPSENDLKSVFDDVAKMEILPYVDNISSSPLVSALPAPGSIVKEREIKELGVTELTLSNGVRVVLKPTEFKNDEVLMSAYSPGGTSLVPDQDYIPASTATAVVGEGGVGSFSQTELSKMLAGKIVAVAPSIGELSEGLSGTASPQDLETFFQLIHLYMTAPRKDNNAFLSYKSKMQGMLQNRNSRPETAFSDTLQGTLSSYHLRRRPWSDETMKALDLEKSYQIYRDRFADASDFTFYFVGNFKSDQIRSLSKQYLATLPATGRNEKWRDVGVSPPTGVIEKEVRRGVEPKSQVAMIYTGQFEYTRENRFVMQTMMEALEFRLREALREEKGGTYGVGTNAQPSKFPRERYSISIGFGCAPDRVPELTKEAMTVIEEFRKNGPTVEEVSKVKETHLREREIYLNENRFWLNALQARYTNGEDPLTIPQEDKLVAGLTANQLHEAAKKYLDPKNFVRVILMPEK